MANFSARIAEAAARFPERSAVELVGCSDSSAKWRVLGKVPITNKPSDDEQRIICAKWPDTEQMYTKAKDYVLCLGNK